MTSKTSLNDIPLGDELLGKVFALLSAKDLAQAEATCTLWHKVTEGHKLWQQKTEHIWGNNGPCMPAIPAAASAYSSQQQWKRLYMDMLAFWRIQPSQKPVIKHLIGHTAPIACLAALSSTFASGSADQTVRLWDRHTGKCKAKLDMPSAPLSVMLLSDDMVVVTCDNECSIWKGSKCIRHILSIDRRRIRATAIQDNLIFMVTDGSNLIQVWDLYSGLQQHMFRPNTTADIFALAAGTVHGIQVLVVGTRDSRVLVLKQTSGTQLAVAQQIGASPITGIALYEDNTAMVTAAFDSSTNLVHFALLAGSIANDGMTVQLKVARVPIVPSPGHKTLQRLGAARIQKTYVFVTMMEHIGHHFVSLLFSAMPVETEQGNRVLSWCRRPAGQAVPRYHCRESMILSGCGVLLTHASLNRIAVWHFPELPD